MSPNPFRLLCRSPRPPVSALSQGCPLNRGSGFACGVEDMHAEMVDRATIAAHEASASKRARLGYNSIVSAGPTTTGEGSSASERPQSIAPAGIDPPAVVAHTATHVRWGWWVFRQWRVEPRWSNVRGDGVGDVGAFAHGNATSRACADIGLGTVRTPDGDRGGCKSSERPRDHKAGFIGDGVEHRGHLVGDSRGGRPCGSGLRLGKR